MVNSAAISVQLAPKSIRLFALRFHRRFRPSYTAYRIGCIIICLQLIDGILTFAGISSHGAALEGNSVLRFLIEAVGPFFALFMVKSCAVGLACFVVACSRRVPWAVPALGVISVLYSTVAVLPWLYILTIGSI